MESRKAPHMRGFYVGCDDELRDNLKGEITRPSFVVHVTCVIS